MPTSRNILGSIGYNVSDPLNLERTVKALTEYDALSDKLLDEIDATTTSSEAGALVDRLERLSVAVGAAYGEDTKDRNDPATCRQVIRPGPRVPVIGQELSFVRRMVTDYLRRQAAQNA